MSFDSILANVQENAAMYAVGAVTAIVITVLARKWVLPFLYHCAEYTIYCTVVHTFLAGFVRAFSWFREETEFKNFKGEVSSSWVPYTTPFGLDFWQKELYNPQWLFWIEAVLAVLLLYVVIVIRPTRLKHKAVQSKKPKPGQISGGSYNERMQAAGRKMKSRARAH